MKQIRIILDSSVYGKLVLDDIAEDFNELVKRKNPNILIYGNKIIRDELRNTPKHILVRNRKLRMLLINLYDLLVKSHSMQVTKRVEDIANFYSLEYKGNVSKRDLRNDFLIVAFTSVNNLTIVISQDSKTMLSKYSLRAYKIVNKKCGLTIPLFYSLKEFEEKYLK